MKFTKISFLVIIVFFISLIVRHNQLNNNLIPEETLLVETMNILLPMKHHYGNTIGFLPIQTFNNSGDKYITQFKRIEDKDGNNYYTSYPPFAWIFAHNFLSFFSLNVSKWSIQLLNNLIFIVCIGLLLAFLRKLGKNGKGYIFIILIVSFYALHPVNLYLFTEVYTSELVVIPLFLGFIFITYLIEAGNIKVSNKFWCVLLFSSTLLMVYTEWLGLLAVLSYLLLKFLQEKSKVVLNRAFWVVASASIVSLLITFIQYACINGFYVFLRATALRFAMRSGFFQQKYSEEGLNYFNVETYHSFFINFNKAMMPIGYVLLLCIIVYIVLKLQKHQFLSKIKFSYSEKYVIFIALVPVLLHIFILFNVNALHLLCWSKFTIPLTLILFIVSKKILLESSYNKLIAKLIFSIFFLIAIIWGVFQYNFHYIIKSEDSKLESYAPVIKIQAQPDEAIFVNFNDVAVHKVQYLCYTTTRNMKIAKNINEAKSELSKTPHQWGIYFDFSNGYQFQRFSRK